MLPDTNSSDNKTQNNNIHPEHTIDVGTKYVIIRSFVSCINDQFELVEEALDVHTRNNFNNNNNNNIDISQIPKDSSLKLSLGIACGEDLSPILPKSVEVIRKLFSKASTLFPYHSNVLEFMSMETTPLSGLALLYPIHTSMIPHYDSPTQYGQREEWLGMITLGNPAVFRCNQQQITMYSGDVLVMDSMAVLHGVDDILEDNNGTKLYEKIGLPFPSRLGILFWQGHQSETKNDNTTTNCNSGEEFVDCISDLFE